MTPGAGPAAGPAAAGGSSWRQVGEVVADEQRFMDMRLDRFETDVARSVKGVAEVASVVQRLSDVVESLRTDIGGLRADAIGLRTDVLDVKALLRGLEPAVTPASPQVVGT